MTREVLAGVTIFAALAIMLVLTPSAAHAERRAFPGMAPVRIGVLPPNLPGPLRVLDDANTQSSGGSQNNTGGTVSSDQSDGENGADATSAGGAGGSGGNNGGTSAGNGGNGGNGAGASPGGFVLSGNGTSRSNALNMLNTVIIRIGH
jgi:hypothetical protein